MQQIYFTLTVRNKKSKLKTVATLSLSYELATF